MRLFALLILAAGSLTAQQTPSFSATATEVIVRVTVTDDRGYFVRDLTAADFRLFDEGRPQRIRFAAHNAKEPLVIGFLVDQSNALRIHWKDLKECIRDLIFTLLPGDKESARYGYLIGYANEPELLVNTTSDANKLADAVDRIIPGGAASLYDALYRASGLEYVAGGLEEARRVLVIIGSGANNAGTHSLGQVAELAQRNQVTVYAVGATAFGADNPDQAILEKLTRDTGGRPVYPLNNPYANVPGYLSIPREPGNYALEVGTGAYASEFLKSMVSAIATIQGELSTEYVLRYTPDVDPETKAKLTREISVETPSLPNARISFRRYYYPKRVQDAPSR